MIRLVKKGEKIFRFGTVPGEEASSCEISTLYKLYGGCDDIASFYIQEIDGAPRLALVNFRGTGMLEAALLTAEMPDVPEIAEFIRIVCGNVRVRGGYLLMNELAALLGRKKELRKIPVMRFPVEKSLPEREITVNDGANLKDMYLLLSRCFIGFGSHGGYENWMTDTSQRVRNGGGRLYFTEKDGNLVSGGGIYSRGGGFAVISSVATVPEERGKGYAGAIVARAVKDIIDSGDTPIICAASSAAQKLYASLGFETFAYIGII